ncbi:hypothetical protein ARMSODRAFT_987954 [Armillaria solidipes]|uniref:Uncharacterized protein n=1 Tax=Armillaria solidipes TaxID=1076256 RepID=A0A2H3C4R1_9AGAR|nr:hypothetical protein ARMSODRAFT_987954 [Armillaria solidipes]
MCYLDILDNLPCLCFSSSQFKMILWILCERGACDVPMFTAFRRMQEHVHKVCSVHVEHSTSDFGNIFYTTDIHDLVSHDLSNPLVAPHVQIYPEDVGRGPISEMWQVPNGCWHELLQDMLPPSILVGFRRYYIHEVAELTNGSWVIPQLWVQEGGTIHADCFHVERLSLLDKAPLVRVLAHEKLWLPVSDFAATHSDIAAWLGEVLFDEDSRTFAGKIPNCNRQIDQGDDLFTIWVPLWADDVSGACTKQYQKHINVYSQNANLPGTLLQQEFFVRFISTSPHATALEQLAMVTKHIKSTHLEPVESFNAATGHPCRFRLQIPDFPADNPQQSEEVSHIGHQGNCKCQACKAGGSNGFKATAENYHEFYEVMRMFPSHTGAPHSVQEIRACVLEQLRLATFGVESHVESLQTSSGTKDKIAYHWIDLLIPQACQIQKSQPTRCHQEISEELLAWLASQTSQPYNALLDIPFVDPSQDTLHNLHSGWTLLQQELFAIRLQSTDISGLRVPPIHAEYMMQYRNALIGKHFKTLIQTTIFHLHDIVTVDQLTLIRALGELRPVLWMSTIDDMDEYLGDLQLCIDNVLNAFANLDPAKILIKIKLHTLIHECFNAVFRMCSILSNHQAPSRDIAQKLVDLDRVKHILSGGFWRQESQWVNAGHDVRSILRTVPVIQQHLGWVPPPAWDPGFPKAVASKKRTGDKCYLGSWAIYSIGCIACIFIPSSKISAEFALGEALHHKYGMPVLLRPSKYLILDLVVKSKQGYVQAIQFTINVQHDCDSAGCTPSGLAHHQQEHLSSEATLRVIKHREADHFVVNMHAFHNARLLRKYLPQYLTVPRPLYSDRQQHH